MEPTNQTKPAKPAYTDYPWDDGTHNCFSMEVCLRVIKRRMLDSVDCKIQILGGKYPQYDDNARRTIKENKRSIKIWKRRLKWIRENQPAIRADFPNSKKDWY